MDRLRQPALDFFCRSDISRSDFIRSWLTRSKILFHEVSLDGGIHFVIPPEKSPRNVRSCYYTAHYDRYKGSPGANDNGAAVISLLVFLSEWSRPGERTFGVVFTDREELTSDSRITDQGSYALGNWFREFQKESPPFFIIFDLCGIGDTLLWSVLSTQGDVLDTGKFEDILGRRGGRRIYRLPVLFSDNAGFHRAGFSSFQVSLLPRKEAEKFYRTMQNLDINTPGKWTVETLQAMEKSYPSAWKTMHTGQDIPENLEERASALLKRILVDLSAWQPGF